MKTLRLICLALSFTALAAEANAQIIVQGKGDAVLCYKYSARGNTGSLIAIRTCSDALNQGLSTKDKAATFVNRGILFMRRGDHEKASKDYRAAIDIKPDLTAAYVNYGAALIREGNLEVALKKLNIALEDLDSETRPEAFYNRAIIFDRQENFRNAYFDLKAALALRPDWEAALSLIGRYEVSKAG